MAKGKTSGSGNKRGGGRGNGRGRSTNKTTTAAPRREPTQQERSAQTIAGDRKKIRLDCHRELKRIEEARASLNEDAAGVRERLKNSGIQVKPFMEARRIVMMDDNTARDTHVDELHESLEDLGIGGQADWIDQIKKSKEKQEAAAIERVEDALAGDEPEAGDEAGEDAGQGEAFEEDQPRDSGRPAYLGEPAGHA